MKASEMEHNHKYKTAGIASGFYPLMTKCENSAVGISCTPWRIPADQEVFEVETDDDDVIGNG